MTLKPLALAAAALLASCASGVDTESYRAFAERYAREHTSAAAATAGGSSAAGDGAVTQLAPAANLTLVWMAPFFSGGGYCSEATSFVLGLREASATPVAIQQHGDSVNRQYMFGLDENKYEALQSLASTPLDRRRTVSVCHSEPGAWHISRALPQRYATSFCPVLGSAYTIGRTMFETDRAPAGWAERLNGMREVWVPTQWQLDVFAAAGVSKDRMLVVPEPVDVSEFRPFADEERAAFLNSQRMAWLAAKEKQMAEKEAEGSGGSGGSGRRARRRIEEADLFAPRLCELIDENGQGLNPPVPIRKGSTPACPFRFLAVGKWERRKGFDLLLRSLYVAFGRRAGSPADEETRRQAIEDGSWPAVDIAPDSPGLGQAHIEVYVLTSAYHSSNDFNAALQGMISTELTCGSKEADKLQAEAGVAVDEAGVPMPEFTPSQSYCLEKADKTGAGGAVLPVIKLLTDVPQRDLPEVYRHVDALVQPSRGEGWGRPHVEAMASGLPVLATNWSGTTEFLTATNGYPVRSAGLLPIPDGAFKGHLQAEPDVTHLAEVMRAVVGDQDAAAEKGRQARQDMVRFYSPRMLGLYVQQQLQRIDKVIDADAVAAAEAELLALRKRAETEAEFRRLQEQARAAAAAEEAAAQALIDKAKKEDAARAEAEEKQRRAKEAADSAPAAPTGPTPDPWKEPEEYDL